MKNWYFLMAGGLGTRARPLSLIKPKPAFPLNGTPLLSIMLDQLERKGLRQGFINTHYLPDEIHLCIDNSKSDAITFFDEEELSGSRILTTAAEYMEDADLVLVVNGDIYLDLPAIEMIQHLRNENLDGLLLARQKTKPEEKKYPSLITENGLFIGRDKTLYPNGKPEPKEPNTNEPEYMYTGVALFRKNIIKAIDQTNFFDTFESVASTEIKRIALFNYDGLWLDIGDPESYKKANQAYRQHQGIKDSDGNSFSYNVRISPDSKVRNSIIWENTIITGQSVIDNCIVTGNTHIHSAHHKDTII